MREDRFDEDLLDDLQRYEEEIAVLQHRRDALYEQLKTERRNKRETVTDLLYDLQDALEDDEEVTLLRMTEDYGRGGRWRYDEVLTSDGMVADNITYIYGSRRSEADVESLSWWPDDEPLDIETEYLVEHRARPGYINKLADRVQTFQRGGSDVPTHYLHYNGPHKR